MSDSTLNENFGQPVHENQHPRHRLEGVPVDAQPGDGVPDAAVSDIDATFGENPDTSLAG